MPARHIPALTHGPAIIAAINSKQDFDAAPIHGRLVSANGLHWTEYGSLKGDDMDAFRRDHDLIRYVVWVGRTPVVWVTFSDRLYRTEKGRALFGRERKN